MKPFIEKLPTAVGDKLKGATVAEEEVLIQVATDMAGRERFDQRWLVVTDRQGLFLHANGGDGTIHLPMAEVKTARVEALVGGGYLEVERQVGDPIYLYYSNSLAPKFAEVAEGIKQLKQGDDLTLPTQVERTHCESCRRLLPEKDGICPACMKRLDTLKRLLGYINPYRAQAYLLLVVIVVAALAEMVPPIITEQIVDKVILPRQNYDLLVSMVLGLLGLSIFHWGALVARRWLGTWVGFRTIEDMRADLYRAFQHLPLRFYDKRKVGSLISRMTNDSDLVETYLIFDIPFIISNGLLIIGSLCMLFYYSWELTLLVLIPVPPIIFGSSLIWGRMESYWRRWSAKWSRLSSHFNESIRGIRVVKAFAQERREGLRFDRHNDELRQVSVSAERAWVVFFMVMNLFMSTGAFFAWYFGGKKVLGNAMETGDLIAFIAYLWMLYQPLKWFGDFYGFMVRAYAGAERIFEIIDANSEPFGDPQALPMPSIKGKVVFKDAYFGYDPGKPVLKGIDLEVAPGEMIGLVGKSGAGKSTLISLVSRFYDVTRGKLEIDGVDIRALRLEDLRSQIGLVAQQSFLFNTSIAENIRYGRPDATFAQVLAAARAANAHEFIVKKPEGYDMVVGEQGGKLSGGEKQRLAIARAILQDPRILILDEATSSLDTPTEKKIQEAIARLVRGRTTFAIAHRLSTLRSADRLVVVDEGKIAEVGTHEELMQRQGRFYNLVHTQRETSALMAVSG